jgi:hypothetical protein
MQNAEQRTRKPEPENRKEKQGITARPLHSLRSVGVTPLERHAAGKALAGPEGVQRQQGQAKAQPQAGKRSTPAQGGEGGERPPILRFLTCVKEAISPAR